MALINFCSFSSREILPGNRTGQEREKKAEEKKSYLPTGLAGPPPFWIGPGLATGGGGFLFFSSSYLGCKFIKEGIRKLFYYKPDSLSLTSCLLLLLVLIYFLCSLCISLNTRS